MGSVKNRVRNKLFKCFRPAAMDDDSIKPDATDGSGNLVFTCISGAGKSGKISNSLSGEKGKVYLEGGDAGGDRSNKEGSHRSFSAAVKAVLFDASLTKKPARNRKARQISNSSNINMSSEISQKVSKSSSHDHEKPSKRDSSAAGDWKTNYSYWSSSLDSSFPTTSSTDHSLSSSHLSSLALDSTPWSEHKESFRLFRASSVESKRIDRFISTDDVREYRRVDIALCMFLISFSVLIFGGRMCAIFCTSMLFLLFDGPDKRIDSARHRIELPEIGSEEHKKKVIMEGLLERNHSRLL